MPRVVIKSTEAQKETARRIIAAAQRRDRVWIRTPQGQTRSGRVVMRFPTHLVLDGGGRHGTPLVATEENIV